MGCMALFQLVDQNFNSFIQAVFPNLDSFSMDPSIPLKIAEFLFFRTSIHDFFNVMFSWCFLQELGYWVKPISTTWFSKFLLNKMKMIDGWRTLGY
jgi:hypothetical protein